MRLARAAALMVVLAVSGCGPVAPSAVSPSPAVTPAAASPVTTPSAEPSPRHVEAGAAAWISVSVSTLWRSPTSPRPVDAAALTNPAALRAWLSALSAGDQAGLIDRADSQVLLGTRVDVLSIKSPWAQVVVPDQSTPLDTRGYPGWIPLVQLTPYGPPTTPTVATVVTPTSWLSRGGIDVLEVSFGTRMPVLAVKGPAVEVGLPDNEVLDAALSDVAISKAGQPALAANASSLVATARKFLGLRYLWAGTSGFGFDCSGLVYAIFNAYGVVLPRDAQDQAAAGTAVGRQSLQAGDLVFLATGGVVHHVALYIGSGQLIDSPDLGRGVQVVSLGAEPYASEYSGARRVLP